VTTSAGVRHPDYGIDAPGVIRNLLLVTVAGVATWATAAAGWWSGVLDARVLPAVHLRILLAQSALWPAAGCGLMACWMVWYSRAGKTRGRERLLDQLSWRGAEQVLDVGCGRGLMLIGAAKRLSTGRATGIDIWQSEDLSGNTREAALENAAIEGVADRVEVRTADMRDLPFQDGAFDRVVSCAAIHNISASKEHAKAIREIARVLKPGGTALVDDIRHSGQYAEVFAENGCSVRRTSSRAAAAFLALLTMGSLQPATLVVEKNGIST
jgi:ubiquinone/menaquinone biosynthesis C-methylase UbiE